jgi:cytochrome c biogenesis protein CcmG, thiol:disulfide interchange protein DsbE
MRPVAGGAALLVAGGGRTGASRTSGGRPGAGRAPRPADHKSGGSVTMLAVLVGVALTLTACLAGPPAIADGQGAHGFSLPSLTQPGQRISLAQYAGRPVIINFCASWSPVCQAAAHSLGYFREHHVKVQIITIDSRDGNAAGLSMMRAANANLDARAAYPVAADPTESVAGRYGVPGLPATYFINAQHVIVKTDLGWLDQRKLDFGMLAMDAGD